LFKEFGMDANTPRDRCRLVGGLTDPRIDRTKHHSLEAILVIALLAVICGADGWTQVALFGRSKRKWLETFLDLPHGIPSHDTFGRVFSMLDPDELERCIVRWTAHLAKVTQGQLIAIDGKTLRRSFDRASKRAAIHMVSAWSSANQLALGQLATDAKSNEITAIPRLLKLLDLTDAVVTIDAMGCQKKIAGQIIEQGGDYVLQVKDNHKTLHEDVKLLFDEAIAHDFDDMAYARHKTIEKDHGRIETREIWSTWDIEYFKRHHDWPGLRSVVCVQSTREMVGTNERTMQRRYFISSLDGKDAPRMLDIVRGHWGIENQLHWRLDMAFREDDCRIRQGHAAENFSRLRRLSQAMLMAEKTHKAGLQTKRLRCGWDHDYLLTVLNRKI